jgi:hypothetical protein
MSLAADPNQTYEYSLEADMSLPVEKRPVFFLKYMTTRQWRQHVEIREKIRQAKTVIEIHEMVINHVVPNIKGWKNVKGCEGTQDLPFSADKVEEVLSLDDIYELMSAEGNRQKLTADDKKKLDSPSN